jgi:hypothetical protein
MGDRAILSHKRKLVLDKRSEQEHTGKEQRRPMRPQAQDELIAAKVMAHGLSERAEVDLYQSRKCSS